MTAPVDGAAGARSWRGARWAPVAMLLVATTLALLAGPADGSRRGAVLAVAGVAAAWSVGVTARRGAGRARVVALAVHTVLAAVLVGLSPWFGFFAYTGYLVLDGLPAVVAGAGLLATALVVAGSQAGGFPGLGGSWLPYLVVAAVNAAVALAFVTLGTRLQQQNVERGATIARLGAVLAENAALQERLLAGAREAGVLEERQRLAGEIHDTLAQGLAGVVTQLEAAEAAGARGEHLDRARALARESLTEARRSVRALRPEQLDRAPLPEAVAELARSFSATTGVPARTGATGTVRPLPVDVETALFRAAQEGLANVAQHAQAATVGVTLSFLDDVVVLDVRDDGRGCDPALAGGYGLAAMRSRVGRLGGGVVLESAPGEGTALNVSVPVGP